MQAQSNTYGAKLDFSNDMSYGDYLALDSILTAQHPLSKDHNEMLFIIIQQLENHVLVPKVMQKAVGINPLISIFSVMIGIRMGGAIGALVAIPIATCAIVFVKDYLALRRGTAPEL